jgi:hypothetical protein
MTVERATKSHHWKVDVFSFFLFAEFYAFSLFFRWRALLDVQLFGLAVPISKERINGKGK